MLLSLQKLKKRWMKLRAYGSFLLVAFAQFMSPSAAADPASRIDPPAWSHRHTKEEIQANAARAGVHEPEKKDQSVIREVRLRRILRRHQSGQ